MPLVRRMRSSVPSRRLFSEPPPYTAFLRPPFLEEPRKMGFSILSPFPPSRRSLLTSYSPSSPSLSSLIEYWMSDL